MKKFFFTFFISTFLISCDKDRCDEGYKPYNANGHEICIPEYLNGRDHDFKLGNTYYHEELGVITLEKNNWKNKDNKIVFPK